MKNFRGWVGFSVWLASSLVLSACGGGGSGSGSTGATGSSGASGATSLVSIVAETAGANCASGGSKITAGLDANSNGVLDSTEVTSTQYVCNGASGTTGSSSLVSVTTEAAGSNCTYGGNKLASGLDANANGTLDATEITTTRYICNGATGSTGASGTSSLSVVAAESAGSNCAYGGSKITSGSDSNVNGTLDAAEVSSTQYVCNGAPGATGATSLIDITTEAAGANCATGGNKITAWLDADGDGMLDASESASATTAYVCNGAGTSWVAVTDTSVQMAANTGYLAENLITPVTLTLPPSASLKVGDTLSVSGLGAGGWKIAQNDGQSIVTSGMGAGAVAGSEALGGVGTTWTAGMADTGANWSSVASSADGSRLVAVNSDSIFTSSDYGVTWTAHMAGHAWSAVASSADGSRLVVVSGTGIYTSSDYGASWRWRYGGGNWSTVASSSDGSKLVAAMYSSNLYISTDYGETWTVQTTLGTQEWTSVASSADGHKLVATAQDGVIYTSADAGSTWTTRMTDATRSWAAVASSSNGNKLLAANGYGYLYTSVDSGGNWTARLTDKKRTWMSVASSADGTKLVATGWLSGQIYTSTDSGVSWTPHSLVDDWNTVAFSSDGSRLIAAGHNLYISAASTSVASSTVGTSGALAGDQYETVTLQYVGNGQFIVQSHEGVLTVY